MGLLPAKENQSGPNLRRLEPMRLQPLPDQPLVSVLIPSYNYGRYIGMTLQSLLDQTYQNFEAIVCDDGSTDDSTEVVQKYAAKDSRIKLLVKEHSGLVSTTNMAYANSKGQIVALLDSDDVFKPSKLEKVVAAFRSSPRSGVFMNRVQPVSAAGRPIGQPKPHVLDQGWLAPGALRRGGISVYPPGPGLSFRREVVSGLFPVPSPIRVCLDGYVALCAQFITEISTTSECLTEYRIHGANTIGLRRADLFPTKSDIEGVERFFSVQRDFLRRVYGPEVAEMIRLEDVRAYWRFLLAHRALNGKRAGTVRPFNVEEMIEHVANTQERLFWRFIMKLPDPLAKRAYRFCCGSSVWQHRLRAVLRRYA